MTSLNIHQSLINLLPSRSSSFLNQNSSPRSAVVQLSRGDPARALSEPSDPRGLRLCTSKSQRQRMSIEPPVSRINVGIPWSSATVALTGLVQNQNLAPYASTSQLPLVSGGFCSCAITSGAPAALPMTSAQLHRKLCLSSAAYLKKDSSTNGGAFEFLTWEARLTIYVLSLIFSPNQDPPCPLASSETNPSSLSHSGVSVFWRPTMSGGSRTRVLRSNVQSLGFIGLLSLWLPGSRGFSIGFSPGHEGLLPRGGISHTGAAACAAAASSAGRGCAEGFGARISGGTGGSGILNRLGGMQARGLREAARRGTGQGAVALSMQTQARGGMASLPGGGGPAWMMTELLTAGDVTSEDGRCLSPALPLPPFPPLPLLLTLPLPHSLSSLLSTHMHLHFQTRKRVQDVPYVSVSLLMCVCAHVCV
jgi:hypothetical protein